MRAVQTWRWKDVPDPSHATEPNAGRVGRGRRMSLRIGIGVGVPADAERVDFVLEAERLGVDAPVNRAIVRLVRWAETGAKPWPPAALRRDAARF